MHESKLVNNGVSKCSTERHTCGHNLVVQAMVHKSGCTCTYEPCSRKGICCECVVYHRQRKELPGCFFSKDLEATYDRSIDNFIKNNNF